MHKVFQTIIASSNGQKPWGNCVQAAVASLFELPLEEVPHFLHEEDWVKYNATDWFDCYYQFLKTRGYRLKGTKYNTRRLGFWGEDTFKNITVEDSINGYFEATVYSPGFFDRNEYITNYNYLNGLHAVIIDKDFNIVHDPNPNYQGTEKYPLHEWIGYNGVLEVYTYEKYEEPEIVK